MERLIKGTEVSGTETAGGVSGFCEFFCLVRKGHEECGDSALVYADERKAILAVFDGVSGEPGASSASSAAAASILKELSAIGRVSEKRMKEALLSAHGNIRAGLTTASIAIIERSGAFIVASVGDSPIYSISSEGKADIELPLARTVGDGASVLKFFYFRNMLTSAIGGGAPDFSVHIRKGRLRAGDVLILASDGLSDNLYVGVADGYVTESSGVSDLAALAGKDRSPEKLVKCLAEEVSKRLSIGRVEMPGRILIPKEDDLAILAVRFGKP